MIRFIREFKEFAIKGNMIDIAIGVVIGAAFNEVVDVLVEEVLLPPLSFMTEDVNYADRKWILRESEVGINGQEVNEIAIGYGKLIEASIDFLIIGVTVFLVVKIMNSLRRKSDNIEDTTVGTPKNIELLNDLKDLMQEQNEILKKGNK